jgi:hypothetical protein
MAGDVVVRVGRWSRHSPGSVAELSFALRGLVAGIVAILLAVIGAGLASRRIYRQRLNGIIEQAKQGQR